MSILLEKEKTHLVAKEDTLRWQMPDFTIRRVRRTLMYPKLSAKGQG